MHRKCLKMNKKFLLLLFCFISEIVNSQELSFDYLIESTRISGEKYTGFQFYNSKTQQVFSVRKHNQKFIGSLSDVERKLLHYFYIYEKDGKYNAVYSDSYTYNPVLTVLKENIESTNNIEVNKIGDLNYDINVFKSNRSKKSKISVDVTLEKSAFSFFEIFIDSPESLSISEKLEKKVNEYGCCYWIAKYKVIYRKNNEVSVINSFNKADLKLIIPNKLNIKHLQSSNSQ